MANKLKSTSLIWLDALNWKLKSTNQWTTSKIEQLIKINI